MKGRNGEKIGWIGGWLGGFAWVLALGIVFLFQGKTNRGLVGLALFALALLFILLFAPWKRPDTPYWNLMLPLYFMFFFTARWAIWSFGGWQATGLSWWSFFWILPVLMPLFTAGRRTWKQIEGRKKP